MAGALHFKQSQQKHLTALQLVGIYLFGTSYGPAPPYVQLDYQYRMSKRGWEDRIKKTKGK